MSLKTYSKFQSNRIKDHYNECCKTAGNSIAAVNWFNCKVQNTRFSVLSQIANLDQQSVLDIGAGLGDFYGFLSLSYKDFSYLGIDFSEKMLSFAKKNFPDANFKPADFLSSDFFDFFDYLFVSGTFNHRIEDNLVYINFAIEKMFTLAKKGVAFNLLSSYSPLEKKNTRLFFYYSPEKILEICFKYTKNIVFKHDYLPNDFTIYMYK